MKRSAAKKAAKKELTRILWGLLDSESTTFSQVIEAILNKPTYHLPAPDRKYWEDSCGRIVEGLGWGWFQGVSGNDPLKMPTVSGDRRERFLSKESIRCGFHIGRAQLAWAAYNGDRLQKLRAG